MVFNSQNGYSFPNAGIQTQQQQNTNEQLQTALNNLGSVPNYSAPDVSIRVLQISVLFSQVFQINIGANLQGLSSIQWPQWIIKYDRKYRQSCCGPTVWVAIQSWCWTCSSSCARCLLEMRLVLETRRLRRSGWEWNQILLESPGWRKRGPVKEVPVNPPPNA
jgi:hypothetical protein